MKRILVAALAAAVALSGDTLYLHNGRAIDGSFVGGDNHSIRFASEDRVGTYRLVDIDSIQFGGGPNASDNLQQPPPAGYGPDAGPRGGYPPPPPTQQAGGYPPLNPPPPPSDADYAPQPAPPSQGSAYAPGEVPAGTPMDVRLIDDVDSERDPIGQTYRASIDEPVVINGQMLLPRGTEVTAKLVDAQQSGKIEGKTSLTLDLKSVHFNGRNYPILTTGVIRESASRGERSAKVIGGAAVLGAIIGAAAGGGKGAAIGAGSGAAVGTAAQVATSGQRVRIPSETRLTFTLQRPLDL